MHHNGVHCKCAGTQRVSLRIVSNCTLIWIGFQSACLDEVVESWPGDADNLGNGALSFPLDFNVGDHQNLRGPPPGRSIS